MLLPAPSFGLCSMLKHSSLCCSMLNHIHTKVDCWVLTFDPCCFSHWRWSSLTTAACFDLFFVPFAHLDFICATCNLDCCIVYNNPCLLMLMLNAHFTQSVRLIVDRMTKATQSFREPFFVINNFRHNYQYLAPWARAQMYVAPAEVEKLESDHYLPLKFLAKLLVLWAV